MPVRPLSDWFFGDWKLDAVGSLETPPLALA